MVKRRTVYAKIEGSSPFSFEGPTVSETYTTYIYIYITNYIVDRFAECRTRKERYRQETVRGKPRTESNCHPWICNPLHYSLCYMA